jgi:hypothetical protein
MMGMSPGPTSTQGPTIYRGEVPPTPKAIVTDAEWLRLLARASTAICPRLTDSDRERLESIAARLPNPEASEIMREREFVWKWIERAIFDDALSAEECLSTLAHYPGAPWNEGRWDVDHKPYAERFYRRFPKAREALSSICKGEQ